MKIGIDISINSTGICINTDTDYKFYNICKSEDVYDKKSNYRKWYNLISNCVIFKTYKNSNFADSTLGKLSKYNTVLNQFISIFSDNNITPKDTIINIEDYSYTKANTNSIIDIVTLSTLIRNYLYLNEYAINFISPKELKVKAGSLAYRKIYTSKSRTKFTYRNKQNKSAGRFDKNDILQALIDAKINTDNDYINFITRTYPTINEVTKNIPKPFDDLNDAYLLSIY